MIELGDVLEEAGIMMPTVDQGVERTSQWGIALDLQDSLLIVSLEAETWSAHGQILAMDKDSVNNEFI